jgi:hypothetical protein
VLAGAIAGGKLTAATYCLALAAAAAVAGPWRGAPTRLAALALGGTAGFVLTFGVWGWTGHGLHGSPLFPYFNHVFNAPDAAPLAHADLRFRPAGVVEVLLIPVRLLVQSTRYSELVIRDPRLALGLVALGLWAVQYGIYRYVLPLEMLACVFVVLALQALPRGRDVALAVATIAVLAWTDHPNWGRTRFGPDFAAVAWPALPPRSLVVTASGEPLAYAAIGLPDDVPLLATHNNFMRPQLCTGLQEQVESTLRAHEGPIFLLRTDSAGDDAGEAQLAASYGLVRAGACGTVESNLGQLRLCPVRREPRPRLCDPNAAAPGR